MKESAFFNQYRGYNIFLSGGGSMEESYNIDELFLELSGNRVLYIPVGLKRTFVGYDECVEWFKNMVKKHNKNKQISVWIDLKNKKGFLNRDKFDSVYIGGASDTLRLHKILKNNDLYPALKEFLGEGGLIYGGSGGASVLGRSISLDVSCEDEKSVDNDSEYFSADLCHGYSVFTHLKSDKWDSLKKHKNKKIIALPEQGGAVINSMNNQIIYIGETKGVVISDQVITAVENGNTMNLT